VKPSGLTATAIAIAVAPGHPAATVRPDHAAMAIARKAIAVAPPEREEAPRARKVIVAGRPAASGRTFVGVIPAIAAQPRHRWWKLT